MIEPSLQQLTALYSPLDIAYAQAMSGSYNDLSVRNDECEIVAGLKDGRISGFWRPMVAVGEEKALQTEIERLWLISQDIFYMDFLINGELSVVSKFLLRQGYQAKPYYTQIIDLTKSVEELHVDLRKSYKSLVHKRNHLVRTSVEDFQKFSESIKGVRRPQETWDIQKQMACRGLAFCIFDTWPQVKSGAMFYVTGVRKCDQQTCKEWIESKNGAYYASSASVDGAYNHAVVWEGIMTCKEMGCKWIELGEQVMYEGQKMMDGNLATEKNVGISGFKHGFGGKTVTRLILEKV